MIFYWFSTAIINSFSYVLDTLQYFPIVTSLPYGVDSVLTSFVATVQALIVELPFLAIIWQLFLLSLLVQFILWIFELTLMIYGIIRGGR